MPSSAPRPLVGSLLGFDLGGTRLKAAVVDVPAGKIADLVVVESAEDADHALALVDQTGSRLLGARRCDAVGLAVPGLVEPSGRIVALPGKLAGIVGRNLAGHLRTRFGAPALVVNDAVAYGVGEARDGAGRGHERVVVVTIGTGVGVSVLEGGKPITAGTLGGGILGGQIPIASGPGVDPPDGPVDTNGKHGTIEALCRARRIRERARAAGGDYDSVREVYAAAAVGEQPALRAIGAYRADLARALVALAHAHAPSMVVVGGGPMAADSPVFDGLAAAVNDALWPGYRVEIAPAVLGDRAALLGLARLAEGGAAT